MDIAEIEAAPRGTEFYIRVGRVTETREKGWYSVSPTSRPGALTRAVSHLDIECVAPARPLKVGERVMRDGCAMPRTVLFIHGDAVMLKWDILDRVELAPAADLRRVMS